MLIRYRSNVTVQLATGAAAFLVVLVITDFTMPGASQWLGAALIGVAGFLLGGYRYRKKIHNVYILVGHPSPDKTFCDAIADAYERGARERGYAVIRQDIAKLTFDPILHKGYEVVQELEPDLVEVQKNIKWADHIVLIYPNWWSSMPALLKGLFDRIWLPGFAYHFHRFSWTMLLKGRTARLIITLDNHPIIASLVFGDYTDEVQNTLLEFAGIRPTDVSSFGSLKFRSERGRQRLLAKAYRMGRRAL
ncbi:MAG: NAD(P)H-dependent oxidoreductase [Candidatus Paceibacterota bacterium]